MDKLESYVRKRGGKLHHTRGRGRARMFVRIRDGFKCKSCGDVRTVIDVENFNKKIKKGVLSGRKKLHDVHHLNGQCGKNSRGYDSTSDLSGMITLCHKCHYNHHQFSKIDKNKIYIVNKVISLRRKGLTYTEIGEMCGFTKQYANYIDKKYAK